MEVTHRRKRNESDKNKEIAENHFLMHRKDRKKSKKKLK